MIALFKHLKDRWKAYCDERFLRKHGCSTWKSYHRQYDPGISRHSHFLDGWYPGYPHVLVMADPSHDIWRTYGSFLEGLDVITSWCAANCEGKWRHDIHRMSKNSWRHEWEMDELGGCDYMVFAFKEERDKLFFSLRWP